MRSKKHKWAGASLPSLLPGSKQSPFGSISERVFILLSDASLVHAFLFIFPDQHCKQEVQRIDQTSMFSLCRSLQAMGIVSSPATHMIRTKATLNQIMKGARKHEYKVERASPSLLGSPFKKGVCNKVYTVSSSYESVFYPSNVDIDDRRSRKSQIPPCARSLESNCPPASS